MYNVADADVKLCVDVSHHIPLFMEQNGTIVARVSSVKPLGFDLKAKVDSIILACKEQTYTFIDVDSDMDPDADWKSSAVPSADRRLRLTIVDPDNSQPCIPLEKHLTIL